MNRIALAFGATIGLATTVHAAPSCRLPATLPVPHVEGPTAAEPTRRLAIGSYTLSMIWSPQVCRAGGSNNDKIACRGTRGFVLHGLWPDGEGKEWPQYCAPAPVLSPATIRAHYCTTPSPQLLQHEWTKHGTCMPGYTPERYFKVAAGLFGGVRWPAMERLSRNPGLTADTFARAFAAANPGMRSDMIRLNLDKEGWLREVWLCLDTRFRNTRCPAEQGGARGNVPVKIWRGRG